MIDYEAKGKRRFQDYFFISVYWIVLSVLFNRFGYTGSAIVSIAGLLFYLFVDQEKKLLFMLSALPFMAIYKISPSLPSVSFILYFIFILTEIKNVTIKKQEAFLLIFFVVIQSLLLLIYGKPLAAFASIVLNIVFLYVFYKKICGLDVAYKESLYVRLSAMFILATGLMSILSMLLPGMQKAIGVDASTFILGTNRVTRFSGIAGDPNYYTQLITIAVALTISYMFYKKREGKLLLFFSVISIYLIYCGFLTFSKSFYVVFAVLAVLLFFYVYSAKERSKRLTVFLVIVFPLIIVVGYYTINSIVIPRIMQRVTNTVDLTSGRTNIWNSYLRMLFEQPQIFFVGAGANNARVLVAEYLGYENSAHNVYLELISDYGIVGCITLLALFGGAFKNIFKSILKPGLCQFIVFLLTSFSLSLSAYDTILFVIPLALLAADNSLKEVTT